MSAFLESGAERRKTRGFEGLDAGFCRHVGREPQPAQNARGMKRSERIDRAFAAPLLGLLWLCACSRGGPPNDADARAEDQRTLEQIVALDLRASRAMREADTATGNGNGAEAVALVATRAKPAVEEGLRAAASARLLTPWGRSKRDELASILHDRDAEMPRYEDAARGADPSKLLAAIEAQAAIERRALATVATVTEGR